MPQQKTSLWVGLAKETVSGTFTAPVDWLPVLTFDGFDAINYIPDKGLRGSAVDTYNYIPAAGQGEITFGGDVYPESIPRALYGLMGELASVTTRSTSDTAGVTTNASTAFSGATLALVWSDVGREITASVAGKISPGTTIASVVSGTAGVLSAPAIGTTAVTNFTIGTAAQYAHNTTVLNTPPMQAPTYSLTVYNGTVYRSYSGLLFSELAFKFSADGLLGFTCKAMGNLSATQAGPYTATFNAGLPIASWNGFISFAGVQTALLESIDITINRPVAPIHNIATSQSPYKIWQGALKCSGKAIFIYESDAIALTPYLAGTNQQTVVNFSVGTGATRRTLQFQMSKLLFINPTKPVWAKDFVEMDTTFEAVANTQDVGASAGYGPVRVQAQSAVTAYST